MTRLAELIRVALLLSTTTSVHSLLLPLHFVPPVPILQVGYPAGFRAFIPDFPGCERFSFHGKLNSPFVGDEAGSWTGDILRPDDGFWTFEETNSVLSPGDVLHYWTLIVKDKVPYLKKNLTWTVPSDPNDAVDFITPISVTKSPNQTVMKMMNPEDATEEPIQNLPPEIVASVEELNKSQTTPTSRTPETITQKTTSSSSLSPDGTNLSVTTTSANSSTTISSTLSDETTSPSPATSHADTNASSTTTQVPSKATTLDAMIKDEQMLSSTTEDVSQTQETSSSEAPSSIVPLQPLKTPPATEKLKATKPEKSTSPMLNPLLSEDIEELTTPAFEKPLDPEFPQESPLFPFPSLFPNPFKPPGPLVPTPPGFGACANPWNFAEQPGESRTQRLEKQVAKLQCDLAMIQRGTVQLGNTIENELNDMKKLIYGMVGRMSRLETLLRTAAFG